MPRSLASIIGSPDFIPDSRFESLAERTLSEFFHARSAVPGPLTTDALTTLVDKHADDLDVYADLSKHGDAEGVTHYKPGARPKVFIVAALAEARNDHRFRTTLAHELGHVLVHGPMFDAKVAQDPLPFGESAHHVCRRDGIESPEREARIEWQAWALGMALLMPMSGVRPLVNSLCEQFGKFGEIHHESTFGDLLSGAVSETFRVSTVAARIRLVRCGVLVKHVPVATLF